MRHFDKIALLKNIGSSWLGLVVNIATGIVVSPYILHRLGDEAFGLWVLVFSLTGYYGLFDLGIRSSVVRYVARFSAIGDREQLSRVVNTSFFAYTCICVCVLAITLAGSLFLDRVIHMHAGYIHTGKILFFMVGASLAVGFPLGVFAGILEGLQRFYLINSINIVNTILRAVLIVVALNRGYGLLTVAWITVLLPVVNQIVNAINVFRLADLEFAFRFISRSTFRELFRFGSVTFVISLAGNLRFKTDAVVIGAFLSAAAITPFAIGSRIVDYATGMVDSLAQVFTPMSSHFDARGEMDKLRSIFIGGNRGCALVIFPICTGLVILGKSVIQVWMGAKYVPLAYPVLLVLLFPTTLRMSQATSGRILYGMARHQTLAAVVLLEGLANLALSIILVRRYGILGDAFGTAIPLTATCVLFLPRHLCRMLKLSVWTFLRRTYAAPLALCVPLAAVLLAMRPWFYPRTLPQLTAHLLAGGLVYGLFVYYFMFIKGPLTLRRQPVNEPEPFDVGQQAPPMPLEESSVQATES